MLAIPGLRSAGLALLMAWGAGRGSLVGVECFLGAKLAVLSLDVEAMITLEGGRLRCQQEA